MDDAQPSRRRYRAFISYSRDDRLLAAALEEGLQRLAKPARSKRIFDVFLDLGDIPGGGSLPDRLRTGLDESDFLILVASPSSASSYWVGEEIRHWLATRSVDELIIVLADGDLVWDSDPPSGVPGWAPGGADVLPPPLRADQFTEPPTWVDFREHSAIARAEGDDAASRLSLDDPGFKVSVARVQAPLRGPGWNPSDIVGEDLDLWRAAQRRRRRAIAALIALAVVSTIAGIVAVVYAQRSAAQERTALSRQLAAQSDDDAGTPLDLGLLLAVEAFRTEDTPDAFGGLVDAAARSVDIVRILRGHDRPLRGVAFSPDGDLMASAALGGSVVLWDTTTWTPIGSPLREATPGGEDAGVRGLAFDPSGSTLVAGDFEGRVHMWDLTDLDDVREQVVRSPSHAGASITQLAFSPDGRRLVTAGGVSVDGRCDESVQHSLVSVDVSARTERTLLVGTGCVTALDLSPDGTIAVGWSDGLVEIFDETTGAIVAGPWLAHASSTGNGMVVSSLAFDSEGDRLVTGGWDRTAAVWRVGSTQAESRHTHRDIVRTVSFADDGVIASGDRAGRVELWAPSDGRLLRNLSAQQSGEIFQLAADPERRWLATASTDATIVVWNLAESPQLSTVLHGGDVDLVEVDRHRGRLVAAGPEVAVDGDGQRSAGITITELVDGVPRPVLLDQPATALAIDEATSTVIIGSADGAVTSYDPESGEALERVVADRVDWCGAGSYGRVSALDTDPAVGRIAIGLDAGWVVVTDATLDDDPIPLARCFRTAGTPDALAWSPDGDLLAVVNGDSRVSLFEPETGEATVVVATSERARALAFDPSGHRLAVGGSDGDIAFVDVDSAAVSGPTLEGHLAPVTALSWHPDGELLVSASRDRALLVWNTKTGLAITNPLVDHGREVLDVDWFGDGRGLASAGGNALLWDLDPDRLIDAVCSVAHRNLTADEWAAFADRAGEVPESCANEAHTE